MPHHIICIIHLYLYIVRHNGKFLTWDIKNGKKKIKFPKFYQMELSQHIF